MPQPPTAAQRLVSIALALTVLAASCGRSDEDAATPSVDLEASMTTPPATLGTATTTTTPGTTTPDTTTPTTTTPTTTSLSIPIPRGDFSTHSGDLFVLGLDGDLEIVSDASAGPPTLVADYADPFGPVNEGPGPNVIDHVAGIVDGTVVFGDCCEPISGSIRVATDSDVVRTVAGGYSPALSPNGTLLGIANDFQISQTAADPMGDGVFRSLNQDPRESHVNVADLTWSSMATAAAGDDHMVLLGWDDDGWWLFDVDQTTLDLTRAFQLGVPPVADAPETDLYFAGHGPDAEVVVAVSDATSTRLRYFAPTTLAELPQLERTLPASASSVRLDRDGEGLLWIDDGGVLYHLPAGELEAERLGSGHLAAWFV